MIRAIFKFGVVGTFVAVLNFSGLWLFQIFLPKLVAVWLAYISAVSVHFVLNKWWVFESKTTVRGGEVWRYVLVVLICGSCTVAVVWLALRFLTKNVFVANALALVPATLISFVLMRRFVFR